MPQGVIFSPVGKRLDGPVARDNTLFLSGLVQLNRTVRNAFAPTFAPHLEHVSFGKHKASFSSPVKLLVTTQRMESRHRTSASGPSITFTRVRPVHLHTRRDVRQRLAEFWTRFMRRLARHRHRGHPDHDPFDFSLAKDTFLQKRGRGPQISRMVVLAVF